MGNAKEKLKESVKAVIAVIQKSTTEGKKENKGETK